MPHHSQPLVSLVSLRSCMCSVCIFLCPGIAVVDDDYVKHTERECCSHVIQFVWIAIFAPSGVSLDTLGIFVATQTNICAHGVRIIEYESTHLYGDVAQIASSLSHDVQRTSTTATTLMMLMLMLMGGGNFVEWHEKKRVGLGDCGCNPSSAMQATCSSIWPSLSSL